MAPNFGCRAHTVVDQLLRILLEQPLERSVEQPVFTHTLRCFHNTRVDPQPHSLLRRSRTRTLAAARPLSTLSLFTLSSALPPHTLCSLSDNPVRFLRGPASFSCPTPLLGVPPPSPPIGPADTPPARQRHRGAWHGAREIIPPEEAPTISGIGRSGRCG